MIKYPIELEPGDLIRHDKYTEPLEVVSRRRVPNLLVEVELLTLWGDTKWLIVSHTREIEVVED